MGEYRNDGARDVIISTNQGGLVSYPDPVPTFDGHALNWRSFWEQFCISVHDRAHLSDSEKLVYLQQSLKGGSAKSAIEGLSRSGEYYAEAIECLQSRYNRPHLIHKAHVRMILEAPSLKEGSGRELWRLHDTVQQHLRALKAMDCEAPGPQFWSSSWTQTPCLNGKNIVRNLLPFLTITSC